MTACCGSSSLKLPASHNVAQLCANLHVSAGCCRCWSRSGSSPALFAPLKLPIPRKVWSQSVHPNMTDGTVRQIQSFFIAALSPPHPKKRNKEFFLFCSLGCRLKYYIHMNFQHAILYFIKPWQRKYIDCLPDSSSSVLLLTLGTFCRASNIPSPYLGFDSSLLLSLQSEPLKKKKERELQQINKSPLLNMLFLLKF